MFTRGPAYFVAFLSGLAALLYQVIWHRLLVLLTGADAASTTMILTGFMAGLGLGSLVGGRLADRLERRHCLRAFAAAELLVGAFGLGDPNTHDHMDIAAIIAGGLTRNNRHFAMPKETPKANLLVAVMHQMGVEQNEIGDSSGVMSEVFV